MNKVTKSLIKPERQIRSLSARICASVYFITIGSHIPFLVRVRSFLVQRILNARLHNLVIMPNVVISGFSSLKLGNEVSIQHGCFLSCKGGLEIGNLVSVAHHTSILTTEHSYGEPNVPIKHQPIRDAPVTIGSNVWIGAQVCILGGVTIADGTIVAAGSVVTKSIVEPNTIVAGVPARFLKRRCTMD